MYSFILICQAAQGQVKGTIVKLTYRGLTSTRPSHIDLVTEGKKRWMYTGVNLKEKLEDVNLRPYSSKQGSLVLKWKF